MIEPGKALDYFLAKRFMGWSTHGWWFTDKTSPERTTCFIPEAVNLLQEQLSNRPKPIIWRPSTDMETALMLAARFKTKHLSDDSASCTARLDDRPQVRRDRCRWKGEAPTLPAAICYAALASMGIPRDGSIEPNAHLRKI